MKSVLVRFKPAGDRSSLRARQADAMTEVRATFLDRNDDGVYDRFANLDPSGRLVKLDLDPSVSVAEALSSLRQLPYVEYAEPNYLVRLSSFPSDPRFGELYGLHNTGQLEEGVVDADIDAPEAWDTTTGSSSIVVGVIDSGIDYNHLDLAANMWVNPGEIAGNGLDDDANGVIDDVHGFNAHDDSGDPMDENGHGTHCAGTIGAIGDNGIGISGVNWTTSLMALSFVNREGEGEIGDAIAAIDYAIGRRNAGVNLRVLSNSWSGLGFSQALQDAIEAANRADILFVASAGNGSSDNDVVPVYPASFPNANIIAVAGTSHLDTLTFLSNFGSTTVDLGAPALEIVSTVPNNSYAAISGTSMAAPYVSGAAALVLSVNQGLTTAQVKELLLSTGDELPALSGITVTGRRLNAANAVAAAGPPQPDFHLAAAPRERGVSQREAVSYQVDLGARGGFTGDVNFSVTSSPPINAVITATPPVVAAPGATTIQVTTSVATAPGLYALTITGESGSLVRTRLVFLRVRPLGTVAFEFHSSDTPMPILEQPGGVSSVIRVPRGIDLHGLEVDLDLTHSWVGDLLITLTSPMGTRLVVHDGVIEDSSDDIHRTIAFPSELTGEQAYGDWVLNVLDRLGGEVGTLDAWTLRAFGRTSAPTYLLALEAERLSVKQNASARVGLSLTALSGFGGAISLSATATPALAASFSFAPPVVIGDGASILTITPSCDAAPGDYTVTIRATSGAIVKESQVTVRVLSAAAETLVRTSTDTPLPIPDLDERGILSHITVTERFPIEELFVEVNAVHSFIGDLAVDLIGPNGETVSLRQSSNEGGSELRETYRVTALDGELSAGQWTLWVRDQSRFDRGNLTSWTLHLTGVVSPAAGPGSTCGSSPVLAIERILRNRATFELAVDLTWSNAQGSLVELHRNNALVDLPTNDGAHRDLFRRYETSFTWKLCEQRSPVCSNEVSVVLGTSALGSGGWPNQATIVEQRADGSSRSRAVKIEDVD